MKSKLQIAGVLLFLALAGTLHAQVQISGSVSMSGKLVVSGSSTTPTCTITTASEPNGQQNSPYIGNVLITSGCTAPIQFSATSLPPGLNINSTNGQITGTPTTVGASSTVVSGLDNSSPQQTAKITYVIVIAQSTPPPPACQITTTSEPTGQQRANYSGNVLTTANCTGPLAFSLNSGSLPLGTSINASNGQVTGVPTTSGTFNFQVKVVDSSGPPQTALQNLSININPAPSCAITTTTEPNGVVSTAYTGNTIQTSNCTAPVSFSTSSTVPGLTMSTSTGVWSGTPTTAGNFPVTITATDSSGSPQHATKSFTIGIAAQPTSSGGHNEDCAITGSPTFPTFSGNPSIGARTCWNTARANRPSPGSTVTASSCADLQTKVSTAAAGETIIAPVSVTYGECEIKPAAVGDDAHWITVKTDQMSALPAEGVRVSPAWIGIPSLSIPCTSAIDGECGRPPYNQPATPGTYLPTLIGDHNHNGVVVQFQSGASHWQFEGIHFTTPFGKVSDTQMIQTTGPVDHILFDQVVANGGNSPNWQNRFDVQAFLTCNNIQWCGLIDSYVGDILCLTVCVDSQGVQLGGNALNPTGPSKITNNFIEASGENMFSGGAGNGSTSILPAVDAEIRLNHFWKPVFWNGVDPSFYGTSRPPVVKNLFEMKNAAFLFVQGNIFSHNWWGASDQFGTAILLVPKNQSSGVGGSLDVPGTNSTINGQSVGLVNWKTGQNFSANGVSSGCAVTNGFPNECRIKIDGASYNVVQFISATQLEVTPPPPAQSAVAFTEYFPGLNPAAQVHDITFMDNWINGSTRVFAAGVGASDAGDVPTVAGSGAYNLGLSDLLADHIDGWVMGPRGIGACCVWATGGQIISAGKTATTITDSLALIHSTFIESLTCPGIPGCVQGIGPGFGFGAPTQTLTHMTIRDNISVAGWGNNASAKSLWDLWTGGGANLCFDHNWLVTSTFPIGPNGNTNPAKQYAVNNNGPYPGDNGATDNGLCGFPTIGNPQIADWNFPQFTSLNGGNNGNYQLQAGSPLHNLASDGIDPGVIWSQLQAAIGGVY